MTDQMRLELTKNKLQLNEVNAALELDKDNEELLSLKTSLEEVIKLTAELLGDDDNQSQWKVGDMCMAMCSSDKLFYRAEIVQMLAEDKAAVRFTDYDGMDVCDLSNLKPLTTSQKPKISSKKKAEEKFRKIEKKKSKKAKIQERNQQMEKLCEKEKNQWVNFNKKMSKQLKSHKSIFASPETIEGRVGIGTCGTGGRPMTKYTVNHSYLKK